MKKFISVLLCVLMAFSSLSFVSFAQGSDEDDVKEVVVDYAKKQNSEFLSKKSTDSFVWAHVKYLDNFGIVLNFNIDQATALAKEKLVGHSGELNATEEAALYAKLAQFESSKNIDVVTAEAEWAKTFAAIANDEKTAQSNPLYVRQYTPEKIAFLSNEHNKEMNDVMLKKAVSTICKDVDSADVTTARSNANIMFKNMMKMSFGNGKSQGGRFDQNGFYFTAENAERITNYIGHILNPLYYIDKSFKGSQRFNTEKDFYEGISVESGLASIIDDNWLKGTGKYQINSDTLLGFLGFDFSDDLVSGLRKTGTTVGAVLVKSIIRHFANDGALDYLFGMVSMFSKIGSSVAIDALKTLFAAYPAGCLCTEDDLENPETIINIVSNQLYTKDDGRTISHEKINATNAFIFDHFPGNRFSEAIKYDDFGNTSVDLSQMFVVSMAYLKQTMNGENAAHNQNAFNLLYNNTKCWGFEEGFRIVMNCLFKGDNFEDFLKACNDKDGVIKTLISDDGPYNNSKNILFEFYVSFLRTFIDLFNKIVYSLTHMFQF